MASPALSDAQACGPAVTATASKSTSKSGSMSAPSNPNFPPPKTDKPRPHVCTTCLRSFARLEHLKRHERSHTKEKPFECPECTRCFARRDLLLRHQQKLHSTTTPSSRPRGGRRESAAGVATGRVRKNSTANTSTTNARPRANTLSHVDTATLGMLANGGGNFGRNFQLGHGYHNSLNGLIGSAGFPYRGMSPGNHLSLGGLPKLETAGFSADLAGGLRTAPPYGGFGAEFGMNGFGYMGNANTINPHALHMHGLGVDMPASQLQPMFNINGSSAIEEDESGFDWMAHGFENQMSFAQANEHAIDDSSPSAMSTNSPAGVNELMLDGSTAALHHMQTSGASAWQGHLANQMHMVHSPSTTDFSPSNFSEMMPAPTGTISPKSLLAQQGLDLNFPTPPDMTGVDSSTMSHAFAAPTFNYPVARNGGASTASTSSLDSSLRQSSITTMSSELVSEHIRNVIIAGLSQQATFGHRQQTQPVVSSPLSPDGASRPKSFNVSAFPSTPDLQRYVSAYLQYFHPHLPFLHTSSLAFDSPDYTTPLRTVNTHVQLGQSGIAGGGGCLILAMAAIGALYEHEAVTSKELFESAKQLIGSYLEERRKANMNKTQLGPGHHAETEDTPLWLVQAMLLNVIYGFNCGDKTAADIASNHCAALVSLARGAELARPFPGFMVVNGSTANAHGPAMHLGGMGAHGWNAVVAEPDDSDWHEWKTVEERKRTLYTVFILSSLLVTAYNHAPALTNSEIRLDLPCDEELWAADNAPTWRAMGGAAQADAKAIPFGAALGHLLTAAQRQQRCGSDGTVADVPESELKPSTFGCLILVNALHNYIWETRQRHLGRQWTAQETEQMHAHIEPALQAWQAAWASNPTHSLERPNPFGAGPLSADSIPLLDLAYVRLFVNLGRSKEAFWQRDYDAMAEELARGPDAGLFTDHPHGLDASTSEQQPHARHHSFVEPDMANASNRGTPESHESRKPESGGLQDSDAQSSRRERHLRKAAFYAADSLSMADKLGLSFAEQTGRELPYQSAMCAFDCAQVLAEWVTTVQERVGRYLGVIGQDEMDLMQVPGILLLEDEDRKLLEKIEETLHSAEHKLSNGAGIAAAREGGYASRTLMLTAYMLERAAVWPATKLMARSLETQAGHMTERALKSVSTRS